MELVYYPGCTLYQKAKGLDRSARACAAALGVRLVELPEWQCCGGLIPQVKDAAMALLGPSRILMDAQKIGQPLVTLCTFCYNTLKRADRILREDDQLRRKIEDFLDEPYRGVGVLHFLEVLRDGIGWEKIRQRVTSPLDIRVAPYYGCLLLRPYREIGMDDPEDPTIMEDLLSALGCPVVDFPARTDCCGSFLSLWRPEVTRECVRQIVEKAVRLGAQVLVTTCPLCQFNLDRYQQAGPSSDGRTGRLPVIYFTQVLALALGLEEGLPIQREHQVSPLGLLTAAAKERGSGDDQREKS